MRQVAATLVAPPLVRRAVLAVFVALGGTGCSAQLGGGWATRQPDAAPRMLRIGGQLEGGRESGAILNGRATLEIGDAERPVALRNVTVGAGAQGRALCRVPLVFGLEGGVELGVGEPSYVDFESPGAYLGARAAALFRLWGDADVELNQYYTLGVLVDLVTDGTAGWWMPPEGSEDTSTLGEVVGQLAVRVTFLSDLTRSPPRPERPVPSTARASTPRGRP